MLVECKNCGAPLDVRERKRVVTCAYCGRRSIVRGLTTLSFDTPAGWRPPATWTPPAHVPQASVPITYRPRRSSAVPVLVLAALLVLAGGGVAAWMMMAQDTRSVALGLAKPALNDAQTNTCPMNGELVVENQTATHTGALINALTNCRVRIVNSQLSGDPVIEAGMNVQVSVEKSVLRGKHAAIRLGPNASATIKDNSRVSADDTAISGSQASRINVQDSTVQSAGTAIDSGIAGKVDVSGSTIDGKRTSIAANMGAVVRVARSTIIGPKQEEMGASFSEQ